MEESFFNQKLNLLVKAIEVTTNNENNLNNEQESQQQQEQKQDSNAENDDINTISNEDTLSIDENSTSTYSIRKSSTPSSCDDQPISSTSSNNKITPIFNTIQNHNLLNIDIVKNFLTQSTQNCSNTNDKASKLLSSCYPLFIGKNGKPTRPFKAYPKEPLSMPLGCTPGFNIPLLAVETLTTSSTSTPTDISTESILASLSNTTDLTTLALNSSDFCSQYRKRIEQAKNRLELKSKLKRKNTISTVKKVPLEVAIIAQQEPEQEKPQLPVEPQVKSQETIQFDQTSLLNYQKNGLIPPPKKRHRVHLQQLEEIELQQKNLRIQLEKQEHEQQEQDEKEKLLLNKIANINHDEMQQLDSSTLTKTTSIPDSFLTPNSSSASSSSSTSPTTTPNDACLLSPLLGSQDDAYKERRRKNNEAAKRSRDARRAKEDEIALRAALLERENLQLKVELAQLKQETSKLRCLLYNS